VKRLNMSKILSAWFIIILFAASCDKIQQPKLDSAEAYKKRGNAYYEKGQYDKAISDYSKAIELNPRYANAYNNRGNVYDEKGLHDKAISDLSKAIELNPKYAVAYNNRAISYFYKKEYDKAWNDVNKVQALGEQVNPSFLIKLREMSGRDK